MHQINLKVVDSYNYDDPVKNQQPIVTNDFFKQINQTIISHTKVTEIGLSPIDQLGIIDKDQQDRQQLKHLLGNILHYPSSQLAQIHRECFRLGEKDLKKNTQSQSSITSSQGLEQQFILCQCCGFPKQQDYIKMCTELDEITNIGVSTYLYFLALKYLSIMLIILFFVYSVFSFVTNIIAANFYQSDLQLDKYKVNEGILALSLGSKQLNLQNQQIFIYYTVQCWLGLGVVLIWGVILIVFVKKQYQAKDNIIRNSHSAADYSVMIHNIPTNITKQDLQLQLDNYLKQMKQKFGYQFVSSQMDNLRIAKFNTTKPFYMDYSEISCEQIVEVQNKIKQQKQMFIEWVKYRIQHQEFPNTREQRYQQYELYQKNINLQQKLYAQKCEQIRKQYIEREDVDATTTVFVTFQSSYAKQMILNSQFQGIGDRVAYILTCCWGSTKFKVKDSQGYQTEAYVEQAPQPEDIKWQNLGISKKQLIKRKIFTFFLTLILLGISFVITFGLSQAQINNSQNQYISFLISLTISIFNIIITQILRLLTKMEKDYTDSNRQASLGFKPVLALLVNSIFIPIMVNYFLKSNLYGVNGLASDIFFLGLTNAFLSPALKIFDMYYWFTRVMAWYQNKPLSRLGLNQRQLNQYTQNIEFQVGYQYVYIVNLFLFTCFFVSLQPIIPLFSIIGLLLMYWSQKYSIFNRCYRPIPGGSTVHRAMFQLISFGPLAFALGIFTWANFIPSQFQKQRQQQLLQIQQSLRNKLIIANAILTGIAAFLFILPYKRFIKGCLIQEQGQMQQFYSKNKMFMPSQYDRLNPLTAKQAIQKYTQQLKQFSEQMKNKSKQQIKKIQKLFINQLGQNRQRKMWGYGSEKVISKNIMNNLFGTQQKSINPMYVLNTVIPKQQNQNILGVGIQNWITNSEKRAPNHNHNGNQIPLFPIPDFNHQLQKQPHPNPPQAPLFNVFAPQNNNPVPNMFANRNQNLQGRMSYNPYIPNFGGYNNRQNPPPYYGNRRY